MVWCKFEGIDESFVEVNMDDCAIDVAIHAMNNKIEGHLYDEHNVNDINIKAVERQCINLNEGTESSDREEDPEEHDGDTRRVRFDYSQKERTIALDDGFEVIENDRPRAGSNRVEIKGRSYRIKGCATKSPMKKLIPKKRLKFIALTRNSRVNKAKNSKIKEKGED